MEINKIYNGNAQEVLKNFPDESINCVMTSPPYWALRDYGIKGQLGLEKTFQEYINKLCDIFDDVKRVLRKDGTCWVNLGDTYYSISGGKFMNDNLGSKDRNELKGLATGNELKSGDELEQKNLCNIPARFSIEMQNRGWVLRNVIIWHKPNCMPSSVDDRFTVDFEYLFFFVKNRRYWFETQREPHKEISIERACRARTSNKLKEGQYSISYLGENVGYDDMEGKLNRGELRGVHKDGRNKRTVWTITTKPFSESHFATFPVELCETPIKSGCPEFICNKCGKPRESIIDSSERTNTRPGDDVGNCKSGTEIDPNKGLHNSDLSKYRQSIIYKKIGLTDCGCNAGFSSGIVLDPFAGAGTALLVAKRLGRSYVGIDLNPEYCKIAEDSIKSDREAFTMSVLKEIRKGNQKILNDGGTNFTKSSADDFPKESLISVKRESADSPNSPHDSSANKEGANFS